MGKTISFRVINNRVQFKCSECGAKRNRISTRQEVRFRCSWNPRLLDHGRFEVENIKDRRIGVRKIER